MVIDNGVPGPNAYHADKTLMGTIYNSKFRSGHLISMAKKLQKCGYKNQYPGPGSYLRFSEFGILVPKNYRRGYSAYNTINTKTRLTNYTTAKTEGNKPKNTKNVKTEEKENK